MKPRITKVPGRPLWHIGGSYKKHFWACYGLTVADAWNRWVSCIQLTRCGNGDLPAPLEPI